MPKKLPGIHKTSPINRTKATFLAPFLARYRARLELADQSPAMQIVYFNCILSHDSSLFYVKNPKVCSSTTTQHIVRLYHGDFVENERLIHEGVRQGKDHWREYQACLADPKTVKFSFTRHPETRLLSAFFDFFVDFKNRDVAKHLPAITARGFVKNGDFNNNLDVFLDYVAESHADSIYECNGHWQLQHVAIGHGLLKYDVLGKMENYDDDLRRAFEMAGHAAELENTKTARKFNVSSRRDLSLSAATKQRIRKIYAQDFERFGYD